MQALCGILGYSPATPECHKNGIFRNIVNISDFFEKLPESLISDQPFCMTGLRW